LSDAITYWQDENLQRRCTVRLKVQEALLNIPLAGT
jgi:hypothetical protein